MTKLRWAALTAAILLGSYLLLFPQRTGQAGEEGKKAKVIQIDLSKLPPDLAKALLEAAQKQKGTGRHAEKKGATGAISLSEAIAIAEKASNGHATSANRKDGLDYTHFTVTVSNPDGTRTRYTINGAGKILQQRKQQKERD
jgi:YD repeat-containing protein